MNFYRPKSLLTLLLAMTFCSCLTCCSEGDDTDDGIEGITPPDGNGGGESNEGGGGDEGGNGTVTSIINRNVSASATYGDYVWTVTLTSTLDDVYPNAGVKYGVEFGEGDYFYQTFLRNLYGNRWGSEISIFVTDAECSLYLSSYNALMEKMKTEELTDDEQQLFDDIVELMDEREAEIRRKYKGRVFVEINGSRYYVLEYDGSDM